MEAKELLSTIKADIDAAKNEGVSSLDVDLLNNYLSSFETKTAHSEYERMITLAKFKEDSENYRADINHQAGAELAMFKSVITTGQSALKASLIINGGAALALLALFGKIWGSQTGQLIIDSMALAIMMFSKGVLYAAFATGGAYLSQRIYSMKSQFYEFLGHVLSIIIIGFVFASYAMFYYGSMQAVSFLQEHLSSG